MRWTVEVPRVPWEWCVLCGDMVSVAVLKHRLLLKLHGTYVKNITDKVR